MSITNLDICDEGLTGGLSCPGLDVGLLCGAGGQLALCPSFVFVGVSVLDEVVVGAGPTVGPDGQGFGGGGAGALFVLPNFDFGEGFKPVPLLLIGSSEKIYNFVNESLGLNLY